MSEIIKSEEIKSRISGYMEIFLVLTLTALAATIYFSQRRASVYDTVAVGSLLVWRFILNHKSQRALPSSLVIWTALYLLSCFIGALLSENRHWELTEFRRYIHFIIAGLLFTAPLSDNYRKITIASFFLCAAIAGVVGILQFSGVLINPDPLAPHGLSPHPIVYAAILAFACGSAIIMFFFRENGLFQSRMGKVILLVTILLTFGGIISSESRGVWIALVAACSVTLFLYDRKKTFSFFFVILIAMTAIFIFNSTLRQRATSIVTSFYTENEKGSTGNRLELWKGSLMIFKERPLLGTGTGNFESSIKRLITEKKLKEMPYTMHAHNIFFQALATRGLIGFVITIGFFATLVKWGIKEIREHGGIGGYAILFCSVLTIVGGLTENNIENGKFLAALCLTIGLIGPYGAYQVSRKSIKQ